MKKRKNEDAAEKRQVKNIKSHLKEDMREAKTGIKRDKKLMKGLKYE